MMKKIVAMAAKINVLKGQLKLDPKLSAIAEDKKKEDKGENKGKKRDKKDSSNKKWTRRGRKCHPRTAKRGMENKWANSPSIGANTTWRGGSTSLLIAPWARSTRKTRRKATPTKPTLMSLHPWPPPPSTFTTRLYWPRLQPGTMKSDGAHQRAYGVYY
jgi:hypothetical protein